MMACNSSANKTWNGGASFFKILDSRPAITVPYGVEESDYLRTIIKAWNRAE